MRRKARRIGIAIASIGMVLTVVFWLQSQHRPLTRYPLTTAVSLYIEQLHGSPDGKWTANYDPEKIPFVVKAQSGTQCIYWSPTHYWEDTTVGQLAWLPDSHRLLLAWKDTDGGDHLVLRSLDTPDARTALQVPVPLPFSRLLGVTPDYRLVSCGPAKKINSRQSTVIVSTVGFFPNLASAHRFTVTLPMDAEMREIALSPKGNRLAWLTDQHSVSAIQTELARLLPFLFHTPPHIHTVSVSVSALDGKGFHTVGVQGIPAKAEPGPSVLRWMPDGKQLQFLYRNKVYTLPAD